MKERTQEWIMHRLDGVIATIGQAVVLDTLTDREKQARELLKDARLLIVEEMEGVPLSSARVEPAPESEEDELEEDEPEGERLIGEQKIIAVLQELADLYAGRVKADRKAAVFAIGSGGAVDYASLASVCMDAARWEAKRTTVLVIAERLGVSLDQVEGGNN